MERLEELHKVASSGTFQGSDTLKNVLLYVGRRSLQSPTAAIKEYEIATQVLGRSDQRCVLVGNVTQTAVSYAKRPIYLL